MRPIEPAALRLVCLAAAALAFAVPAAAQSPAPAEAEAEAATPPPAVPEAPGLSNDPLPTGEVVDENGDPLGQEYILEMHGDWTLVCQRSQFETDPCNMRQGLVDAQGNVTSIADIAAVLPGGQVAAAAQVVTPLETLLSNDMTVSVDGGATKRYPFQFCTGEACVVQMGLTEDDVNAFRRGAQATVGITPLAAARDQRVSLTMSLSGFTAGFARLEELFAAYAEEARAAQAQAGGN